MQAADRVDIATVFTADEDFELGIDGAGGFDERADHLDDCMWGVMDGDERMTGIPCRRRAAGSGRRRRGKWRVSSG